jgi:hypothetical protein
MSDDELSSLGPVDYLVIDFPPGHQNFTGEMAEELLALAKAGTIRVIDIIILTKDEDGVVDAVELSDAGDLGALVELEAELAELLAAEDVVHLASAARRAGGQLIANGRIPIQAIIASLEADGALESTGV